MNFKTKVLTTFITSISVITGLLKIFESYQKTIQNYITPHQSVFFYASVGLLTLAFIHFVYQILICPYTYTKGFKNYVPTSALLARMSCVIIMAIFTYFVRSLFLFYFIYNIYVSICIIWQSSKSYHDPTSKFLRMICDLALAGFCVWYYGGVFSPGIILFLIPIGTLARNYPPRFNQFAFVVTSVFIIIRAAYEGIAISEVGRIDFEIFFHSNSLLSDTKSINIYGLSHISLFLLVIWIIYYIFQNERRKIMTPLLLNWYNFNKENESPKKKLLRVLVDFRCEFVFLIHDQNVEIAYKKAYFEDNSNTPKINANEECIIDSNSSVYDEVKIDECFSAISHSLNELDSTDDDDKFGLSNYFRFHTAGEESAKNIINKNLINYNLKNNKFSDFNSVAFSSDSEKCCLIVCNKRTPNGVTLKNFNREDWIKCKLYLIDFIKYYRFATTQQ